MRSQEHCGTTQLRRIKPTACGSLGTDEAVEWMTASVRLTLTKRSGLRSSNVARTNTITLNVILTIL
jgi:hypothetical protein